jgi:peptidoglycan/xylan/chitin deacetylase (PgdA/CDA1 family)
MTRDEYLAATVRTWLGVPASASAAVPALPPELARRLLRDEEYEREHRDQWGCWEYGFCESYREGRLWEPDVDRWVTERRRELAASVQLEPLWPDGHEFAVFLSHDVDLVSDASTPAQTLRSMRASLAPPNTSRVVSLARPPVRALRAARHGISRAPRTQLLELSVATEREHGVRATYFFTVYPRGHVRRYDCLYEPDDPCRFRGRRQRVADVLVTLAEEGFDVGLHGGYASGFEDGALAREKAALERASGLEIRTTRQHFLHWDVRRTPRLQAAAGLAADSSLGFNRNLGFRAGTSLPFRHFDVERGEALDLVELPLAIPDGPLLRADGLELDVELARETMRRIVDSVAGCGGVASILFHPNNLARPEFLELFRWSIEYGKERGAWFASLRDVDRWWRDREARLAAS